MCEINNSPEHERPLSSYSDIEIVRTRPRMFIGNPDDEGLFYLFTGVLDNAIEETTKGYCDEIIVTLHNATTITIKDNGRGIPMYDVPDTHLTFLEHVLSHFSRDFSTVEYASNVAGHGVPLCAVNALSSAFTIDVYQKGYQNRTELSRGTKVNELQIADSSTKHGTRITFTADSQIFDDNVSYEPDEICRYLIMVACLNPLITIRFIDLIRSRDITFHYPSGIRKLLQLIDLSFKDSLSVYDGHKAVNIPDELSTNPKLETQDENIIYGHLEEDGITAEIAIKYAVGSEKIFSFVNSVNIVNVNPDTINFWENQVCRKLSIDDAIERGSKLDLLAYIDSGQVLSHTGIEVKTFSSSMNSILRQQVGKTDINKSQLDHIPLFSVAKDFCTIISLKIPHPELDGNKHTKLVGPKKVESIIERLTTDVVTRFCEAYPDLITQILQRVVENKRPPDSWPIITDESIQRPWKFE